jgi:hypothetical protein
MTVVMMTPTTPPTMTRTTPTTTTLVVGVVEEATELLRRPWIVVCLSSGGVGSQLWLVTRLAVAKQLVPPLQS